MDKSPHLEAQLGVIGSLLLDAEACAGEIFLRTQEDQYTGEYRTLFTAARQLYQAGRPIDPVTVRGAAGDEYTGLILQIMDLTPTAANYQAYIDLLIEQAQVAKMQALGLALTGCKTTEEALGLLEEANQAVVQRAALRVVDAAQGHVEFLERQDRKAAYLPWGFPKLDRAVLSSLGDFVILGGRPSAGKTALSLQMAWEQAKAGGWATSPSRRTQTSSMTASTPWWRRWTPPGSAPGSYGRMSGRGSSPAALSFLTGRCR